MKASTGIDYPEFFQFLHTIAKSRLNRLKRASSEPKEVETISDEIAAADRDLGPKLLSHSESYHLNLDLCLLKESATLNKLDVPVPQSLSKDGEPVIGDRKDSSGSSSNMSELRRVSGTPHSTTLQTLPLDITTFMDLTLQITPVQTSSYTHTPEGSSYYEGSISGLVRSGSDDDMTDPAQLNTDSWSSGCSAKMALLMHKTLRTTPVQRTSYVDPLRKELRDVVESCDEEPGSNQDSSEQAKCSSKSIVPSVDQTADAGCYAGAAKEMSNRCKKFRTTKVERTSYIPTQDDPNSISDASLDIWHAVFDLDRIKQVLESLMKNEEFLKLDSSSLCDDPNNLLSAVLQTLEEYSSK